MRPHERARREIGRARTLVRETDWNVDADRRRIPEAAEELRERGAEQRVGEPPVVEHDRDPAAAAGVDSGDHRHPAIVAASPTE